MPTQRTIGLRKLRSINRELSEKVIYLEHHIVELTDEIARLKNEVADLKPKPKEETTDEWMEYIEQFIPQTLYKNETRQKRRPPPQL